MSDPQGTMTTAEPLTCGGLPLDRLFKAVRTREPLAEAFYAYDLDLVAQRARTFQRAMSGVDAFAAYALKANGLPHLLEHLNALEFGADAGSLGELVLAEAAGFPGARTVLNGNARSQAEAEHAAARGLRHVNVDLPEELDLLERAAVARAQAPLRVALRVNPGIDTPGHRYIATGDDAAKFGMAPAEALEAWTRAARWPHLRVDGLHLHVGSQILDPAPLWRALEEAMALVDAAAVRGARVGLVNAGGGMGIDYEGQGRAFPLDAYASRIRDADAGRGLEWTFEPGRWLVAHAGVLVSRVQWVKTRGARRFVVLGAGMNDFLRPALYSAHHRIVPVRARAGVWTPAVVAGPVCESGDVFARDVPLPPLERGDLVAILDTGAYGAAMASNYNGRGRLAEIIVKDGRAVLARAAETPADLAARRRDERLEID